MKRRGKNENEVYVYDLNKINFYLEHGVCPKYIGSHKVTHNVFAVFDYYDTQEVYTLWCERWDKLHKDESSK